jgi:hypothetical protein
MLHTLPGTRLQAKLGPNFAFVFKSLQLIVKKEYFNLVGNYRCFLQGPLAVAN